MLSKVKDCYDQSIKEMEGEHEKKLTEKQSQIKHLEQDLASLKIDHNLALESKGKSEALRKICDDLNDQLKLDLQSSLEKCQGYSELCEGMKSSKAKFMGKYEEEVILKEIKQML